MKTVEMASELKSFDATHNDLSIAPRAGKLPFTCVRDSGVLTATRNGDDLGSHRSPFYKLGDSAQTIITEYRVMQENK